MPVNGAFESILENRDMLSEMISGSPIPTFIIDRQHRVTHFNKACETLTGIKAEDIIGTKQQWRAFYSNERPILADIILDAADTHTLETFYKDRYRPSEVKPGAYEAEDYFPDMGENGKWLFFTAAPVVDGEGQIIGAIETLQDITREKRISELNEGMLRISKSLYQYSYLTDLLDYISLEIRKLLETEGALVILLDKEADELYCPGIAYDDPAKVKRVREIRFSLDDVLAGEVIRSGKAVIANDCINDTLYPKRDNIMGYVTRSLAEAPIIAEDRIIGVLCGINKMDGQFSDWDLNLLVTLAGTVALAIENTRYAEELRVLYREVRSLNIAKDKAINHLSHELKTPVNIISDAVSMIEDELCALPEDDWLPFMGMIRRNLKRIVEIKEEVSDIIKPETGETPVAMKILLDQCADLLSVMTAGESIKPGALAARVRKRIDDFYSPVLHEPVDIVLEKFVTDRVAALKNGFRNRNVKIDQNFRRTRKIHIPVDVLTKTVDGLIKNAIENTPDGSLIELFIEEKGAEVEFRVRDHGVGIIEDNQVRIFEGFYPTQEMTRYSTKKPFDFNAGGKGADLLRMKIFSETWKFTVSMTSNRCPHLLDKNHDCPGAVSACPALNDNKRCDNMGGTEFVLRFSGV